MLMKLLSVKVNNAKIHMSLSDNKHANCLKLIYQSFWCYLEYCRTVCLIFEICQREPLFLWDRVLTESFYASNETRGFLSLNEKDKNDKEMKQ